MFEWTLIWGGLPSEFKDNLTSHLSKVRNMLRLDKDMVPLSSIIKIPDLAVVLLFLVFYQFGYPSIQYSSHHRDYHIFKKSYWSQA